MLQNAPMYSYIPAKDVARARRFYEDKLGFKLSQETAGGVVYECGQSTGVLPVSDTECGHVAGKSGVLAGRGCRTRGRGAEGPWRTVRKVRHAADGQERHLDGWWCQGCVVQGQRRKYHGPHPERLNHVGEVRARF